MVNKKKEKVPDLKKQTHIPITKGEKLLALNSKDEDEFYHKYIEVYPNTGRGITAIIAIFKNRSRYKDVLPKEIPKEINIPLSRS
jgi:hypothetical protein